MIDGSVGIGTTSPGQKFDVVGNGRFSGVVVAANPTAPNQLTTKSYVDSAIAGTGDNLGNHTATQTLNMANHNIDFSSTPTNSLFMNWV